MSTFDSGSCSEQKESEDEVYVKVSYYRHASFDDF